MPRKRRERMKRMSAAELGIERFESLCVCLAMAGESMMVERSDSTAAEPRPGLEVMREMAAKDARWARIVLDIVRGRREMPRELDPPIGEPIANTAWFLRAALIVAAAGYVPDLCDEDRVMLTEVLVVAEDEYDDVLEVVSQGELTPATKRALLVEPLRRILDG